MEDSLMMLAEPPLDIRESLSRACADCHSNQTRWPWYSRLAPLSWAMADDVHRGRRELNFSRWREYDREEKAHLLKEAKDLVMNGHMPPGRYKLLQPSARLSESEIAELTNWFEQERSRVLAQKSD
jgi:hypothetical protein